MTMTQERADVLTRYLESNMEKAKELLQLNVDEALAEINKDGFDFSVDEMNDYCDALIKAAAQGELDENSLEDVSGGIGVVTGCILIVGGALVAGVGAGIVCNLKW